MENTRKKTKKKYKLKKINFLFVLLFLAFILSFGYFGYQIIEWFKDNNNSQKIMIDIEQKVVIKEEESHVEAVQNEELINKDDPYWDFIKLNLVDVDLKNLIALNSETIGWLKVLGTNINYPFVQATDNQFYLTHDFYRQSNKGGWVFLDYRNAKNLQNKNSIIYAHGRANNTMFGSLKNILKNDWLNNTENHVVNISTDNKNSLWQVFSVYKILNTNDYIQTDFKNDTEFLDFANMLLKRSIKDFKTTIQKTDQILTLSTCYNDNEKVVLHAKLIKQS